MFTDRTDGGKGRRRETTAWRLNLLGHPVKLLFICYNFHTFQVGLHSPHHLRLQYFTSKNKNFQCFFLVPPT